MIQVLKDNGQINAAHGHVHQSSIRHMHMYIIILYVYTCVFVNYILYILSTSTVDLAVDKTCITYMPNIIHETGFGDGW